MVDGKVEKMDKTGKMVDGKVAKLDGKKPGYDFDKALKSIDGKLDKMSKDFEKASKKKYKGAAWLAPKVATFITILSIGMQL